MRDVLKDRRRCHLDFSQEANQALEHQREIIVTEANSGVWRRDE